MSTREILRVVDEGVGEFLRNRRARLSAEDVGLPARAGRRRVPGLRREDLAQLANVSVDYYTRLEQGRTGAVSDGVLDAIAKALHLDAVERQHLGHLVKPIPHIVENADAPHEFVDLVGAIHELPALVLDPTMDVLAYNAAAAALFEFSAPAARRNPLNVARLAFAPSGPADRIQNRSAVVASTVAHLRYQAGRIPDDPRLALLIRELTATSVEFRELWATLDVRGATPIEIVIDHPQAGWLELRNVWLVAPAMPDHVLVIYSAEPGSQSEQHLAGLVAGHRSRPVVPGTRTVGAQQA